MLLSDFKSSLAVEECFVFFSYLRIKFHMASGSQLTAVNLLQNGKPALEKVSVQVLSGELTAVVIEAFVDPAKFPGQYSIAIKTQADAFNVTCTDLTQADAAAHQRSSLPILKSAITKWKTANNNRRVKILDVGGRARSGRNLRGEFLDCDFKILDVMAAEGVDFVADAHEMSQRVQGEVFDFVCSTSTFEHLVMPWKVALEINKILNLGGYVFVVTHQSVGLHDLPHDYFRFSSDSWKGIFNASTGFQIIETVMRDFVRMAPMHFHNCTTDYEKAGGFIESVVLAKKIAHTRLEWPVEVKSIEKTSYPA